MNLENFEFEFLSKLLEKLNDLKPALYHTIKYYEISLNKENNLNPELNGV